MRKPLRVLAHSLLLLIIPRITPYTVSLSQQIIDRELHDVRTVAPPVVCGGLRTEMCVLFMYYRAVWRIGAVLSLSSCVHASWWWRGGGGYMCGVYV